MRFTFDRKTGKASLHGIDCQDLKGILIGASLNNHDSWRKEEKRKKPDPENIAYSKGMWDFCNNLIKMLEAETWPGPAEIPLAQQSKEKSFEVVREEKKERLFLDELITNALEQVRKENPII